MSATEDDKKTLKLQNQEDKFITHEGNLLSAMKIYICKVFS